MRDYEMPADTNDKEKSIGGILTFAQGGILGGFTVLGFLIMILITKFIGSIVLGIVFLVPFPCIGAFIAFKHTMDMPIYKYWFLKNKFKKKTKKLIHVNELKPIYEEVAG